jgi:D-alanine-D-alanine ligase
MPQVLVCFGGPSPEHDISILTGLQAARLLADAGHDVAGLYWSKAGAWQQVPAVLEASDFLAPEVPRAVPLKLLAGAGGGFVEEGKRGKLGRPVEVDVVLNCCHGGPGEDGTLQSVLDVTGIRHAGPSAVGAALGMDKLAATALARGVGVAVNDQQELTTATFEHPGPWVVKPRWGGSSIGIEVVDDLDTARQLGRSSVHLKAGAVIEPYLRDGAGNPWVDLNVAARVHPTLEVSPIERPLREGTGIYDYKAKYIAEQGTGLEHAPRELPAAVPATVAEAIDRAVRTLVPVLDVRGVARFDFLWDGGEQVIFNEVNTIPGALSLYLWAAAGHERAAVVQALVEEARRPAPPRWTSTGADGLALRSAGEIAAKLG